MKQISIEELRARFPNASESTIARNLQAFTAAYHRAPAGKKIRLRQSHRPLMNRLETRFREHLRRLEPAWVIRVQAKRFRLANGLWYKPDFTATPTNHTGPEQAWEVKGPHAFRGGYENLKMAATQYPEIVWTLVWWENNDWKEQLIAP